MEPPERGRQEVGAGSRAGADREGARPKPAHVARRLLGSAQQREGLARGWLYHARRGSRPDALPVTPDESDAKVRFECAQGLGGGGQRAATPSAGPIVVQAPGLSWADGPPPLPGGAGFALVEGIPAEAAPLTLRLKFPPNYRVPPHWHAVLEHVTVLSGTLNVGMGEQPTYSGGTALSAGSYAVMPQKMVHYAWTGSDGVVFQLHSVGPWSITYVNQ